MLCFSECVARVPVWLWGSGGAGCVRSTLPNRPQPFAWGPYGRAYRKFCRGGPFLTCRYFVSRGTSWHSDVFCNVSKVVLRGRRNTFATFVRDVLQFSWQAQHFGRIHRHFSWQAQHFRRVVLAAFRKSHWQGCVKWRQGANSVAGVAFFDMCWKLTEASHETSILRLQNLEVLRKIRRKMSIFKLQSENVGGSLVRNARFGAPTRVSGFPVASSCLWGKLHNMSFRHVSNCANWRKSRMKCSFFCRHVFCLESLVFLWLRRVYGGNRKTSPFQMFLSSLSFRFAWQAWHFVRLQPV